MRRQALIIALALVAGSCGADDPVESASCSPFATAAPSVDQWTTDEGCAVATERIRSHPGPAQCGWELVDYLVLDGRTYHWDPVNFLAYVDGRTRNRTVRTADLPAGVIDSGLRRGDEQLWEQPEDPDHVYLVRGEQADRWVLDAEGVIVCR